MTHKALKHYRNDTKTWISSLPIKEISTSYSLELLLLILRIEEVGSCDSISEDSIQRFFTSVLLVFSELIAQ